MARLLVYIALMCGTALTGEAQVLYTNISGGVMVNSGIEGKEIADAAAGYSSPMGGITLLADGKRWQVGAGIEVFSINNNTHFVFEQDILPNGRSNSYHTSIAAPAYTPYASGNYKWWMLESKMYVYGGVRMGVHFAQTKSNEEILYNALNSNEVVYLKSKPGFIYGLQAGMATVSRNRWSTGFNVAWQTCTTTADVNYRTVYLVPDINNVPRYYVQDISKTLRYSVNLLSIQVYLRLRLFGTQPVGDDTGKPENN